MVERKRSRNSSSLDLLEISKIELSYRLSRYRAKSPDGSRITLPDLFRLALEECRYALVCIAAHLRGLLRR